MDVVVSPGLLEGCVRAPQSKSQAHRLLLCAALAQSPVTVGCTDTSQDIEATLRCLSALGAPVVRGGAAGIEVGPLPDPSRAPRGAVCDCGESGSTLRFMVPVAAALGNGARLKGTPRLLERPLGPLAACLESHGARLVRDRDAVVVEGRLTAGDFSLPGDVSSQFVTGLLLASPLLDGAVRVRVEGPVASAPYIELTRRALALFGRDVEVGRERDGSTVYSVCGRGRLEAPGAPVAVEGDWSNAAFWLACGALGSNVCVTGLDRTSPQGDRAVCAALALLGASVDLGADRACALPGTPRAATLSMEQTPDLVPPVAAVCATRPGTSRITGCARLRIKESDRVATVCGCLSSLGVAVHVEGDDIVVDGGALSGGTVDAANDHRIAMMAAVCATRAQGPVTVLGAECVAKSYPRFFDDFAALGGRVREVRP